MSQPGNTPPGSGSAPSLSICIVAHNEAANIGRTLASVAGWAGEIVVIDCESSDGTGAIAGKMGALVHERPNIVPEATKNISFDLASLPWVFSLDADEIIPDSLKREIEETIARAPSENGFKIPRRNFYFGSPLMHGGNYPDKQLRLFKRGMGRYPGRGYHERIEVEGAVGDLRNPFDHHPYPTFDIWLRKFQFYTDYGAGVLERDRVPINAGTIRHHMIVRPMRRWLERLLLKRGIRDGVPGVLAASFDLITNIVSFGKYWMKMKEPGDRS
jgi:glycosyltransferase involved in cell wall biosynthesis